MQNRLVAEIFANEALQIGCVRECALPPEATEPDQPTWEKLAAAAAYRPGRLAALCQVSLRTLERHFKKRYQLTLADWLAALRLDVAYKQLGSGESIKSVAYGLGFKQLSHFSRAFKKRFGSSPRFFAGQRPSTLSRLLAMELPRLQIIQITPADDFPSGHLSE